MPFARAIGWKEGRSLSMSIDDALQAAYMGLVQAAGRFDELKHDPSLSSLDTNFQSFAYRRIRGSIQLTRNPTWPNTLYVAQSIRSVSMWLRTNNLPRRPDRSKDGQGQG
jgi:DNA-directed RNA polymerase specialized sigma subunit